MNRLTTDHPNGIFETMMNFVYGKDGWARIRHDGEKEDVPLTQWAKKQCIRYGCGKFDPESPENIDVVISSCVLDFPDCPVALAYCFASQACHLHSRLQFYEDIFFDLNGRERIPIRAFRKYLDSQAGFPVPWDELLELKGKPVWIMDLLAMTGHWEICQPDLFDSEAYGKTWLAYRTEPQDCPIARTGPEEAEHG